ncbi:MAG TPA: hypothetical protein VN663_14430 [Ramlibacter sp.]|jgi:hypothetical protein|nr:hypothetical protein [Ramlibacter sp.]
MARLTPRSNDAVNNPVASTGETDPMSQLEIGESNERVMRSTGDATTALDKLKLEQIAESPMDQEWHDMMRFNEEMITIKVATTTDLNAEQVFEINVNGRLEFFRRGETKTVKRYIVDHMLRMKETRYTQREIMDEEGIRQIVNVPHTALKYDFSVIRDDNPRGGDWLKWTLAQKG